MTPKNLLKVESNILPKIELVQLKIDSKILPTVEKKPILMEDAKYKDFADRLNALMKAKDSPIKTINELKRLLVFLMRWLVGIHLVQLNQELKSYKH